MAGSFSCIYSPDSVSEVTGGSVAGGVVAGGSVAGGSVAGGSVAGGSVAGGVVAGGSVAGGVVGVEGLLGVVGASVGASVGRSVILTVSLSRLEYTEMSSLVLEISLSSALLYLQR